MMIHPPALPRPLPAVLLMLLFVAGLLLASPATLLAEESEEGAVPESRVEATVVIPAELVDFHGSAMVVTLYEYNPLLADVGATAKERLVVRHLGHQQGIEQTLRFRIGDTLGEPRPDRKYYLSCRIYNDEGDEDGFVQDEQLHYCHNEHPSLPGTVYDEHNRNALTFTAR